MRTSFPSTPLTAAPAGRPRRHRPTRRAIPLAVIAVLALGAGVYAGARGPDERREAAAGFAAAWERGDYAAMHRLLSERAERRTTVRRLERTYTQAAQTATLQAVDTGRPVPVEGEEGVFTVRVRLRTRAFGTLDERMRLRVSGEGDDAGVDWTAAMAFPGLRRGETLSRTTDLGPRADILARDGTPLAEGPERTTAFPPAAEIAGQLGPVPADRAAEYERLGIPEGTQVGLTGLEREFDERLLGRPGGTLKAGERVIARVLPAKGQDVRTSIDPRVQRAASEALAGRLGGVAVIKPTTGEVLGLAGIAFSATQPPGSTFKIVTLAGALEAGVVKRSATFPEVTSTTIEGVELENANGEVCGGSLAYSFAHSCNSVFAPMGAKLGAERLVKAAERFGFNEPPPFKGAAESTIPPAKEIGDDLAVGSTAIGQGLTLSTPLAMASVAATIADGGLRRRPTLLRGGGADAPEPVRATPAAVARTINRYMRKVVREGTGKSAAIPGVTVAGKTGTAELRDTTQPAAPGEPGSDTTDTTAWFAAFAPASRPRVAVAVMLPNQGTGGDTAAPVARQVLAAALKAR